MHCEKLDMMECNFIRAGKDWTPQKVARLFAIKDHLREGHEGKPCPDPENRLQK
jgi:hypothetical protein